MRRFFTAPVFAEEERTQSAGLFHIAVLSTMAVTTISLMVLIFALPNSTLRWIAVIAATDVLGLALLLLNRRGRTRQASFLFVGMLASLTTALASTAGGIRAPSVTANILIVLISTFLLGEWTGILTSVICIVISFCLVVAEVNGILPASAITHTAFSLWVSNAIFIMFAVFIQLLAIKTIKDALSRAKNELEKRKQTEDRLREATERFRLATQAASIGVWDRDLQTDQIIWDDRLFAIYGLERTRDGILAYQSWAERVHPDDLSASEALLKRAISERESVQFEFRNVRPNGEQRCIQAAAAVISDEQGAPIRMAGINIDVTEQKEAERERLRLVHDLGKRVKELTLLHQVARMLQAQRPFNREFVAELVALIPSAWQYPEICEARIAYGEIEATTPGWRETEWKQSKAFAAVGGTGAIEVVYLSEKSAEAEGPFLAEERRLLESFAEMLEAYLNHQRAAGALQQREAEFRAIFEQAAIGITLINLDGYPVTCNPALEHFLGYSTDELSRMSFIQVTHPDDLEADRQLYLSVIAGERDHYQIEKRYIREDGRTVWGRLTVSLVRDADNKLKYGIGMVEDITARKKAEEDRTRLEAQLRQSQKIQALGTLAGGVAHDFNNILTTISGNAHLAALCSPSSDQAKLHLSEITKASARASDLVRQILAFSRQQETVRKTIKLKPVVEEALKLLRAAVPAMIEIRTDYASNLPDVSADSTQIHQIIMNLGTNAAHAIGERGGLLEVRLDVVAADADADFERDCVVLKEGPLVRLAFSDNGCGMDKAILERIFDPFFTTKAVNQGTGLGLSVVDAIMKNHDGAVAVQSEPGQGTTFRLYFPASEETVVETQTAQREIFKGRGESVLYVDDEEGIVFMMTIMLEDLGYKVTGYTDASQALQAFRSCPRDFDIVVTDYSMPLMTGREFAQELLKIRSDLPIVMTSGYVSAEDAETVRRAGIREIILKPSTVEEIGQVIHRLLKSTSV